MNNNELQIEHRPPTELVAYARNSRKHSPEQIPPDPALIALTASLIALAIYSAIFAFCVVTQEVNERLCFWLLGGSYNRKNSRWRVVRIVKALERCSWFAAMTGAVAAIDYLAIKGFL
jgi:hypothetical protein